MTPGDVPGVSRDADTPEADSLGATATSREIAQQPALWHEVGAMVGERREAIGAFLGPRLERPELRIVLTGAGTSAFAGEILAPALTRALRRRVDAVATTDVVSNPLECFAQDVPTLLVSFARSGDSPESVPTTALAERHLTQCLHLVVTCHRDGALFRAHQAAPGSLVLLMPEAANDQGFAMTSSFTCMTLAVLLTLGEASSDRATVERLATAGEAVLAAVDGEARALAEQGFERFVYLGSGPLRGLARESALKLLELTAGKVVTYAHTPLGFRHGPKSVLDDTTLALVYLSNDPVTRLYDLDIVEELRAALGSERVIAITAQDDERLADARVWRVEGMEDVGDGPLALPFVLCAQLLALHCSLALGLTPDDPFPSGEVNRVVRGVRIHAR